MAEGNMCATMNQKFLPCVYDLKKAKDMDWCGYILDYLKKTKHVWDGVWHYHGPLLFLVLLFAQTWKPKVCSTNKKMVVMNRRSAEDLADIQAFLIKEVSGGGHGSKEVARVASRGDENEVNGDMEELVSNNMYWCTWTH